MKRIMTGIEDFKEIIDNGYYYIDKTNLIEDVNEEKVVLYTRPRRFGKTLNMSMLYYFFSNKEKGNAYLFNGLKISSNKELMKLQNRYPVISISLKDMKNLNIEEAYEYFNGIIKRIIVKYYELYSSSYIVDSIKEELKRLENKTASKSELENSLLTISECLYQHFQNKVIILIDEYDVPLQSAYINGYYDEMVNFLRNVFSSALKTNGALEKGVMTGCLRIAKESIFTGLNNFAVRSTMDVKASDCFGFTQKEINELLEYFHIEDKLEEMKEWYDGYLFGNIEIYNPWSSLYYVKNVLENEIYAADSFWSNTSGNDIVIDYITKADTKMYQDFEVLMKKKSIKKHIKKELTYRDMDDIDNIYSFLLATGYLKVQKRLDEDTYELLIPNKEVYKIYQSSFMNNFTNYVKPREVPFLTALKNSDTEKAMKYLNQILLKTISYFDNKEDFYHGYLGGILYEFETKSNDEKGDGRADIVIYPETISDKVIVIECKHSNELKNLISDSKKGAKQIIEKRYMEGILAEGYQQVLGYGISFYKKQCYITKAE